MVMGIVLGMLPTMYGLTRDQNTVALWNLNEGKGTELHDLSGNNIKFRLHKGDPTTKDNPAPKWTTTPGGKGLLFRAEDRRQYTAGTPKLTDKLTIEMWIKPVKNGKRMGIYQAMNYKKNGFRINLSNNLKVGFCLNGKGNEIGLNSKQPLKSGEWSHVACTYDGKMAKIYINGKLDVEKEMPGYDLSAKYASLGYTGGTPFFNGIIDSVKISNTPLSNFTKSLASFKK